MSISENDFDLAQHFYDGLWGAEHQKRFKTIGDELNKVLLYTNKRNTNVDLFSQTIVFLTLSSYYAGLVPIVRIESGLFVAKDSRNEYAYALSYRAYIEVAGRLHKGMQLWGHFRSKKKPLEDFRAGVNRLMGKFQPKVDSTSGMFKGKGYNVISLVESLDDKIPDILQKYESVSSYVHGGFEEQMFFRKKSWFSELKGESNPIIAKYESTVAQLRKIAFDDFDELLRITKKWRKRYDNFSGD